MGNKKRNNGERGTSSRLGRSRGQIQMSFGMIFSIILIIVFLAFAFYAIKTFLNFQDSAKAARLFDDLQTDIDRVWKSSQSSEQQDYVVPAKVDFVCFVDFVSEAKGENQAFYSELKRADYGSENLVFYPVKFNGFESKTIDHLNLMETTAEENPFCIKTSNGKVSFTLKKGFGEALVAIEKNNNSAG